MLNNIHPDIYPGIAGLGKKVTPDEIIQTCQALFNIDFKITNKKRKRELVIFRGVTMTVLKEKTPLSLSSIGDKFNKDHSTVIHNIKRISREYKLYDDVKYALDLARNEINSFTYVEEKTISDFKKKS